MASISALSMFSEYANHPALSVSAKKGLQNSACCVVSGGRTLNKGFSLVELTVVLLIITLLAGIALRSTNELSFQVRYEQTKDRLETIRQAILGNPKLIVNGQQTVSGFVADMGRLPNNLRELIQRPGDCDNNLGDANPTDCTNVGGLWSASAWNGNPVTRFDGNGLQYGWNGPYLTISGNPADSDALTDGWGRLAQGYCSVMDYTDETSCTSAGNLWTASANDFNFGWYFDAVSIADNAFILSYGKDQAYGGGEVYDADYPAAQPTVQAQDWKVNLSAGISVNFRKTNGKTSSVSRCSDPAKQTKNDCASSSGTWYGGCDKAGHYNKNSCETASGAWVDCSDGGSGTKTACEAANAEWYGEGFGCSDQSKALKVQCTSPSVWRSCSDNGTITDESACLTANQLWYGDNIFNNSLATQKICMKVFFRKADSSIGSLVSDENITNDSSTIHFDHKAITADGGFQSLRFANFRDSVTNGLVSALPIGKNALGIYQHDGTNCTNLFYPSDRQNSVQVDFHAHTGLPVINW